jgi:Leucine-rich repeat (LRR) protein
MMIKLDAGFFDLSNGKLWQFEMSHLHQPFLSSVVALNLAGNNLSKIPKFIIHMTSLVSLDLRNNLFEEVPEELINCGNLTELLMSDNRVKILEAKTIEELETLKLLTMTNNPIGKISSELTSGANPCLVSDGDTGFSLFGRINFIFDGVLSGDIKILNKYFINYGLNQYTPYADQKNKNIPSHTTNNVIDGPYSYLSKIKQREWSTPKFIPDNNMNFLPVVFKIN